MRFLESCWTALTYTLGFGSFSSWNGPGSQHPISLEPVLAGHGAPHVVDDTPRFRPPNGPEHSKFICEYPQMKGWRDCSTSHDRGCWLRGPGDKKFDINTNYENNTPIGVLRKYTLDVDDMELHPDGFKNLGGKVFNKTFPGPWIQACWGDDIEITVRNHLKYNGTTIHWHGIRLLNNMESDGVNGVTQCPIAPGDEYTYKFKAQQYGTSWYHSHYSLQYGDGMKGPLTIYGPSSDEYDLAVDPILMSDWSHRSAFEDFQKELDPSHGRPLMTSVLLNDQGRYNCSEIEKQQGNCTETPPTYYNTTVQAGKKYLLRIINTSVDNTFIFTIDNHNLTVISADFVPIKPYVTNAVLVGIGQRYHVILEAKPTITTSKKNFWIRTVVPPGCSGFPQGSPPEEKNGILNYEGSDIKLPETAKGNFDETCSDEPYDKLIPIVPWQIGDPVNEQQSSTFQVGLTQVDPTTGKYPGQHNYSRWDIGGEPMFLNFSNPTINNLHQGTIWPAQVGVIQSTNTPAVTAESWIYLVVTATGFPFSSAPKNFIPAAHPIHLHGHDFAILQQSSKPFWAPLVKIKKDNPPRRDVALLPANGYLLLAFKADNPGAWLMHCHIAWHASSGLALQILEREGAIDVSPAHMKETTRVCDNWNAWVGDRGNYWNSTGEFQDDSGI
ncbi:hypothetical protein HYFRA_00013510 [Hymenoscyphus fraxineus]|uniref:Laccase n=1 Tax=Hymenoscyphus fraxineus TaxID=746836 RepID=A0A9N9LAQ8_9HELO|nr:hypothetical protein HYFRA_00013510 [Hymenoscyphus fraxineus]